MIYIYKFNGDLDQFFERVCCFSQPFTDPRSDANFLEQYGNLLATFQMR